MPGKSLVNRVEDLEKTVNGLQTLPADVAALGERVGAVELQIVQLRADMNGGFSAVRGEMKTECASVRAEIQDGFAAVRAEAKADVAALRQGMYEGFANLKSELGRQIQEVAEEGKRHTRVLFEEAISRIATLGEHREASDARKPRGRRKR